MADIISRLRRQRYEREEHHNNSGMIGVPCDADDFGAEAYNVNPDGPEAADLIAELLAALTVAINLLPKPLDDRDNGKFADAYRAGLAAIAKAEAV